MTSKNHKIIWAVDPFAEDYKRQRNAAWAIQAMSAHQASIIEPVFIFDPMLMDAPFAALSEYEEDLKKTAAEQFRKITHRVKLPGLLHLKVIPGPLGSPSQGARVLIKYALENEASLIVVSSRARKGLSRWVLGSFAESLLMSSPIPVVVVNPRWNRRTSDVTRILFPTDFSDASKQVYEEVLEYAAARTAEVCLFHKIRYDLQAISETASRHPEMKMKYDEIYKQVIRCKKADLASWAELGKAKGVKITTRLDYAMSGGVAEAVLKQSREHFGMIALAATSGRMSTAILGAVSRRVAREADCPVWVLRPDRMATKTTGREAAFVASGAA